MREPVRYQCPKCTNRITALVRLIEPPTCTRHTGAPVSMKPTS